MEFQAPSVAASAAAPQPAVWRTVEQIDVKSVYQRADVAGSKLLDFTSGIAPFLRGPYATMYVQRPWTVRQYAGFSTAAESNAFYRRNLAAGQRGLWSRSTSPRIAATTAIIRASSATSGRRASRLIPSRT